MIENLQYNTERSKLIIPEYGRHFQKMIDHAVAIEDVEERNKVAQSIIDIMGNLNPHLRDVEDFQHKLWDQLFIMSGFKLDVDSPFPKPSQELLEERPEPLGYPQNYPKYRYYGNNIKHMIDAAIEWKKGDMREALEITIANHMKKCYLTWNKDSVEDAVIFNHLFELSDGQIDLRKMEESLHPAEFFLKSQGPRQNKNNKNNNNRNKNRNKKRSK
ncbi:MAG: DUF4290 domain-containing protein [Flavobacteriaceae bacterium]|nr:DUF4290 domain-containing protein [Flavobacteriaceae bacterium]